MQARKTDVLKGPQRDPDSVTRRYAVWIRTGILPETDPRRERETVAAATIIFELYDRGGVRDRRLLRGLFDKLMAGEPSLIDRIVADADEGSPVLVITHWGSLDGRAATSFVVRLTAELDEPIMAPSDNWEPMLEGVLSLAPLFDKLIDSTVVPFPKAAD